MPIVLQALVLTAPGGYRLLDSLMHFGDYFLISRLIYVPRLVRSVSIPNVGIDSKRKATQSAFPYQVHVSRRDKVMDIVLIGGRHFRIVLVEPVPQILTVSCPDSFKIGFYLHRDILWNIETYLRSRHFPRLVALPKG